MAKPLKPPTNYWLGVADTIKKTAKQKLTRRGDAGLSRLTALEKQLKQKGKA